MSDEISNAPETDNRDPLHRMRAYRLACELLREAWEDAERLTHHRTMERVSAQLYASIGTIVANLGVGYAHSPGKDIARNFQHALRSERESMPCSRAPQRVVA